MIPALKELVCPGCKQTVMRHPAARHCYDCSAIAWELQCIASDRVDAALRRGDLKPAKCYPCTDCGGPASDYDHRDYDAPLLVAPVCRACNTKRGSAKFDLAAYLAKRKPDTT